MQQQMADDLTHRFTHHAPDEVDAARHEAVREACLHAAELVTDMTSAGREQSLAITKLEEAMFWANAAIAREGA